MKLKYTAACVGLTAAATVAVTGCGSDGVQRAADVVDKSDAIMAALARATDRTENLGSAEVRISTATAGTAPITMEGTYSWGAGYAFDVEMDTKAAQMQLLQDAPTMRMLFVDGAYYYDVDPQRSGPLKGKEWMKVDASAVFGEKGAQAFSGGGGGSPAASMKSLKYAKNVKDLGKETVDGQSTTHYRAELDQAQLGKFKDAYGDADSLAGSITGGATSMTMDIWVGGKDLPVRLKQRIGTMTVTMDFEKFGRTAVVKAPPAAETGDLSDALKDASAKQ
ncbi:MULTISPECIES: hypothetical protein [unclassified Streptomyces]|uniref:hypothetical protein n=1 Tax=unclassified Streptomyces TaxID=2593676 RepID=UPI0024731DC5|nr:MULTISPECIES: hypothetical protein [unclassified Streptomyces]MDH6450319.1 hypothetical protein [Streptomyces sp. SAI-119]MDH6499138.1 hypothetical protein [Streptomyces sp. SAI-149]